VTARPALHIASLFASLLAVASSGCGMRGNGVRVVEPRHGKSGFYAVSLRGAANADVTVGEAYAVYVECDQNIAPFVRTGIESGALVVDTDEGAFAPSRPCIVHVRAPRISALYAVGSGNVVVRGRADGLDFVRTAGNANVFIDDVRSDDVTIEMGGEGDLALRRMEAHSVHLITNGEGAITLAGQGDNLTIRSSSCGDIHTELFHARYVDMQATGTSTVYVYASERVIVNTGAYAHAVVFGQPVSREEVAKGVSSVQWR
jgi:hypothetical protein